MASNCRSAPIIWVRPLRAFSVYLRGAVPQQLNGNGGGVPHAGHFALTAGLLDSLAASPDARIVNVSSVAHEFGTSEFELLHDAKPPAPNKNTCAAACSVRRDSGMHQVP
jgi:NAD(P)-dependent dehydrogenase (short-subunit alcohol dehydrogenase family)